jgi:hypothetical protein
MGGHAVSFHLTVLSQAEFIMLTFNKQCNRSLVWAYIRTGGSFGWDRKQFDIDIWNVFVLQRADWLHRGLARSLLGLELRASALNQG